MPTAAATLTRRPQASPTATPAVPSVELAIPLQTRLVTPPPGRPEGPLLGLSALAVSSGGRLVAGTYGNGVMISENGGASWRFHTAGLPQDGTVTAIMLAPDFDAGGEAALLFEEPDTAPMAYRSRDGGQTWEGYPGLNEPVYDLVYSPAYPTDGIVFALQGEYGRGRLLRSADHGASWSEVLPANGCPLNVALSPDASLFASDRTALAPRCDHVVRSTDGGLTWADVPLESGDFSRDTARMSRLQVIPAEPAGSRLLAQIEGQNLPRLSDDGGRNWVKPYDEANLPFALGVLRSILLSPDYAHDASLYAFGLANLYATAGWLWRSTDGGRTWAGLAHTTTPGCTFSLQASADLANDHRLWAATCEGLFRSDDAGHSWRFVHPGGSQAWQPVGVARSADGVGVAVSNRGGGRYTSRYILFEDHGDGWITGDIFEGIQLTGPLFPSADYRHDRLGLVIATDFGGVAHAMALRPSEQPALTQLAIPPGGVPQNYTVTYADDYATSGRIDLRHGGSGALYRSADRGRTWAHVDPAEPGACLRTPVRGFGALWSANAEVRNRLMCATDDERGFTGLAQPFEHGEMLRPLPPYPSEANRWVYALLPDAAGGSALGYYPAANGEPGPLPTPPAGLYPPDATLFDAWNAIPCCDVSRDPLRFVIGWATEPAHGLQLARQYFEGGVMLWRSDRVEIIVYFPPESGGYLPLSYPLRYEVYPDTYRP